MGWFKLGMNYAAGFFTKCAPAALGYQQGSWC